MSDLIDLLLKPEVPNVQKKLPTAQYKVKRLSQLTGQDVIFELRALPYGKVQEIKDSKSQDVNVHIVLAGLKDPDIKAGELQTKFGGITPAETLKAMLLPGEIVDLAQAIEKLTGYRGTTIEEIKKGSGTAATEN